jgi:hypothetical protein
MRYPILAALVILAWLTPTAPAAAQTTARDLYTRALAQERTVRDESSKPTLAEMRRAVGAYEAVVRRHPASGYSDNALWQGAHLAALAYERFGEDADRKTFTRLLTLLSREYPTSKLATQAAAALESDLQFRAQPQAATPVAAVEPPPDRKSRSDAGVATLRDITRTVLPDGIRLTVDLDTEVTYHQEEIFNPRRLFFDLKGVKAAPKLQDTSLKFDGDVVKEVRLGRHPQQTTRVVVDLEGVSGYTVYPLYGPFRLVIDLRRAVPTRPSIATRAVSPPVVVPPPETKAAATLAVLPEISTFRRRSRHRPPLPCPRSQRSRRPCLPRRRRPIRTGSSRYRGSSAWGSRGW